MYSRRRLLKHAARYSALGALILPGINMAFASANPSQQEFELFMGLSRLLTGFDQLDTELGEYYYHYLSNQPEAKAFSKLLTLFSKNKGKSTTMMLIKTSTDQRSVAQSITLLWYAGWLVPVDDVPDDIKAKAYTESLAWKAMELMPRGLPKGQLWQTIAQPSVSS